MPVKSHLDSRTPGPWGGSSRMSREMVLSRVRALWGSLCILQHYENYLDCHFLVWGQTSWWCCEQECAGGSLRSLTAGLWRVVDLALLMRLMRPDAPSWILWHKRLFPPSRFDVDHNHPNIHNLLRSNRTLGFPQWFRMFRGMVVYLMANVHVGGRLGKYIFFPSASAGRTGRQYFNKCFTMFLVSTVHRQLQWPSERLVFGLPFLSHYPPTYCTSCSAISPNVAQKTTLIMAELGRYAIGILISCFWYVLI